MKIRIKTVSPTEIKGTIEFDVWAVLDEKGSYTGKFYLRSEAAVEEANFIGGTAKKIEFGEYYEG